MINQIYELLDHDFILGEPRDECVVYLKLKGKEEWRVESYDDRYIVLKNGIPKARVFHLAKLEEYLTTNKLI